MTIGPIEKPKRNSPIKAPSATAPIRISRYSAGVMLRPARARSSLRVGRPRTVRLRLRLSAAGRNSLSTSSRGVARGGRAVSVALVRSLRIRSRLQKNTAIAAAMGSATARRVMRSIESLKQRGVRLLHGLQGDPLGRIDAGTGGVLGLVGGLQVVVERLERILQSGVRQEPGDDLGLALGYDHRQACCGPDGACRARADLGYVQVGEDRLGCDLGIRRHGSDHGDVIAWLDVVRDPLLLARGDGQSDVAGRDRQVLRL